MDVPASTTYAHSANSDGDWHRLEEHLRSTGRLAADFAEIFGGASLAQLAGLTHDLGKVHPDFQAYLRQPEAHRGPDHSSAGAVLVSQIFQQLTGLVGGHHGGIGSRSQIEQRLKRVGSTPRILEALALGNEQLGAIRAATDMDPKAPDWLPESAPRGKQGEAIARRWELFLRFVFSALVDADFLDTEAHFQGEATGVRRRRWCMEDLWEQYRSRREEKLADAPPTKINRLRNEIYESCLRSADLPPGLFRLTVPTGGGKTLSGMAFALRHALAHDLRRVVVAIPYTSIIEQTAEEYRDIFGDAVLEHHSAVGWTADDESDPVGWDQLWPRLASQNWDAPIVVSTTVQLFESLFSNRPAACRKLHNLTGSVLILDEAQTLPAHLLAPILDVLQELTEHYRVSVVSCTATQPAAAVEPYAQIFERAEEIVPEPERYFGELARVRYEIAQERWSWGRVAEEMRSVDQCLTIVNTKRDALALLDALGDSEALHLSTNLCGIHRKRVLADVVKRLKDGATCRVIATQVVEAGVDIDFPLVLRAVGPLDRVVQAAGRCNREGILGAAGGRVVVFEPDEPSALPSGAYKTGTDTARLLLGQGADLHAPETYKAYFRRLSQAVELDQKDIQQARMKWDFPLVARDFRLIDDDSLPIVVRFPDSERVSHLLERVRHADGSARSLFRKLQPHVVSCRRRVVHRYAAEGLAQEVVPGLYEWWGRYDEIRGLVEEPGLAPEDLVI